MIVLQTEYGVKYKVEAELQDGKKRDDIWAIYEDQVDFSDGDYAYPSRDEVKLFLIPIVEN